MELGEGGVPKYLTNNWGLRVIPAFKIKKVEGSTIKSCERQKHTLWGMPNNSHRDTHSGAYLTRITTVVKVFHPHQRK